MRKKEAKSRCLSKLHQLKEEALQTRIYEPFGVVLSLQTESSSVDQNQGRLALFFRQ